LSSFGPVVSDFGGRFVSNVTSNSVHGVFDGTFNTQEVLTDAFGNALGNSIVDEAARRGALWSDYREQKAFAYGTRDQQIATLVSKGLTGDQASAYVDSDEGQAAINYAKAYTSGAKPLQLESRQTQLDQMSAYTYSALHPAPVAATPPPAPPAQTDDGTGGQSAPVQVLEEIVVTGQRMGGDPQQRTVMDTVAGGVDVGSHAIKKLVDIVGGPKRAAGVMTAISFLTAGPAKTIAGLVLGDLTAPLAQKAENLLGGELYTDVFEGHGTDHSAHVVSGASAGVAVNLVLGVLFSKMNNLVDRAESYVTEADEMAAEEAAGAGAAEDAANALNRIKISSWSEYKSISSGKLKPNTIYEYQGKEFETDALGRSISTRGVVDVNNPGQRMRSVDTAIGNGPGALPQDVGFHRGADSLGFPGGNLNVNPGNGMPIPEEFPGVPNLNGGSYKQLENDIRELAKVPGNTVTADFQAHFNEGNLTQRPDAFIVKYSVNDGPTITRHFRNQPGG
jgi:hypothetical protein